MAHTCPKCGYSCHCGGDIDDLNFGELFECNHCGQWDDDEDEDFDCDDLTTYGDFEE